MDENTGSIERRKLILSSYDPVVGILADITLQNNRIIPPECILDAPNHTYHSTNNERLLFLTDCDENRRGVLLRMLTMRLTTVHSQFRVIGVNYNQAVKHLKATFSEKMALAMLYKLEKETIELVKINKQIMDLTGKFEQKYLKNMF